MTVDSAKASFFRGNLFKTLTFIVLTLIAFQYLLSYVIPQRYNKTLSRNNSSRYVENIYRKHPRDINYTNISIFKKTNTTGPPVLPNCSLNPPNLVGPVAVLKNAPTLSIMEMTFTNVKMGGRGNPPDCLSRHRVAIIVPYRDRLQNLYVFLYNLHPILSRQQIDYQIFIIEQADKEQFNRAMLMNVGFVESLKERDFDCFIFHDIDLIPENDRNIYSCPEQPRHMSVAVDIFNYKLPYESIFGGVSALSKKHFQMVNGFSNLFWGWGGEDDDMANRISSKKLSVSRYSSDIARYTMLTHQKGIPNDERTKLLDTGKERYATDGLTSLEYKLINRKELKLFTWISVELTRPRPS